MRRGDLVFLDPPYLTPDGGWDAARYTIPRFTSRDEADVRAAFRDLDECGAHVMLSARWSATLAEEFRGYDVRHVQRHGCPAEALIYNAHS